MVTYSASTVSNKAHGLWSQRKRISKYFVLNSHNQLQIMLIKTKYSCENVKLRHFGKKHGILAKSRHSRHLTKITVSVISVFP